MVLSNLSLRSGSLLPYMLVLYYRLYYEACFSFSFQNKKKGGGLRMQSFVVPLYSLSYVCLTDVLVFYAFILLPLYN
jgi:hypothetical protein